MKIVTKKRMYILALLCTSSLLLQAEAPKKDPQESESSQGATKEQDYINPEDLMRDFLDLSKKPHEKIQYWTRQFLFLFKSNPKLARFCKDLLEAVQVKNANRIGLLFMANKHLFSQKLRDELLLRRGGKGGENAVITELKAILEKRVRK